MRCINRGRTHARTVINMAIHYRRAHGVLTCVNILNWRDGNLQTILRWMLYSDHSYKSDTYITLWRPLLPYGYAYKASCTGQGCRFSPKLGRVHSHSSLSSSLFPTPFPSPILSCLKPLVLILLPLNPAWGLGSAVNSHSAANSFVCIVWVWKSPLVVTIFREKCLPK